jgi:hypothetical protein
VLFCIWFFVSFCVLFVCICVLYYCHRVATQLTLNISYHITSYVIYHVIYYISYHIIYHIVSYHILCVMYHIIYNCPSANVIYYISYISYHISYSIISYIVYHISYHFQLSFCQCHISYIISYSIISYCVSYIISFPVVLLPMFPVQSCIYHRRCTTSTIDTIMKSDVHIVTRLRDRQPRNRCGITGRGKRMPSSPQCSVRFWESASLPTKA